jgi:hypothetical protein
LVRHTSVYRLIFIEVRLTEICCCVMKIHITCIFHRWVVKSDSTKAWQILEEKTYYKCAENFYQLSLNVKMALIP